MKSQNNIQQEIQTFIAYHPVANVKSNLNRLLIGYLQGFGQDLPKYHLDLLADLEALNDLLDEVGNRLVEDSDLMIKKRFQS